MPQTCQVCLTMKQLFHTLNSKFKFSNIEARDIGQKEGLTVEVVPVHVALKGQLIPWCAVGRTAISFQQAVSDQYSN